MIVTMLYVVLGILCLIFAYFLIKDVMAHKEDFSGKYMNSIIVSAIIGILTDFFDTLGIGSFAPTTAALKATKQCEDIVIPGTLNVSHTIPVALEAALFITKVEVEPMTLLLLIIAAVVGAWLGAGIISKFNENRIRLVMGFALLVTAVLMFLGMQGVIAGIGTGTAKGLSGMMLVLGIIGNFILGALMTAGVGLYAPCMALVYFLGMSPDVAFPIMMASCAFLMPVASVKFIKEQKYARRSSFVINIAGCLGVLVAVYIITSLPLTILRYLVICVILYTAIVMIRAAMVSKKA